MTPELWVSLAGTIIAALGASWAGAKKVWPFVRKISRLADAFLGTPEDAAVPERPGVPKLLEQHGDKLDSLSNRYALVEYRLDRIEHELHPNSGLSMRDALDRVERQVSEMNR